MIDSDELEYPEHLQPANFVDTFALGDNTKINLDSGGIITAGRYRSRTALNLGDAPSTDPFNSASYVRISGGETTTNAAALSLVSTKVVPKSTTTDIIVFNTEGIDSKNSPGILDSYKDYRAVGSGTNQAKNVFGFFAEGSISKATEKAYGFYGLLDKDNDKNYNFYAAGTAPNYFAGNVGIGTDSPQAKFVITNDTGSTSNGMEFDPDNSQGGNRLLSYDRTSAQRTVFNLDASEFNYKQVGNVTKVKIDSTGNVGIGTD